MKTYATTLAILISVFMTANAMARDAIIQLQLEDALESPSIKSVIHSNIKLYWGDQKHPEPRTVYGEFKTSQRTNSSRCWSVSSPDARDSIWLRAYSSVLSNCVSANCGETSSAESLPPPNRCVVPKLRVLPTSQIRLTTRRAFSIRNESHKPSAISVCCSVKIFK